MHQQPPLCPQCQHPARPGARFCGACGAALAPAPQAEPPTLAASGPAVPAAPPPAPAAAAAAAPARNAPPRGSFALLPRLVDLVGRRGVLAEALQLLATRHVAVLSGPPGSGKTVLAGTLARQAAAPAMIFWYSCTQAEGGDSLLWRLAGFLAQHGQDDLWRLLQSAQRSGAEPPPPAIMIDYLVQQLRGQDYLLCLDDLHLLAEDPLLEQLLERLEPELRTGTLSLLITWQAGSAPFSAADVPLTGLSAADTQLLLSRRNLWLPEHLLVPLHQRTEGNPLLLVLAVTALERSTNQAELISRLGEARDAVRFLLSALDATLSEAERDTLRAAAALLGYPAPPAALEALLQRSGLQPVLDELSNRQLITAFEGAGRQEYVLHEVLQPLCYGRLGEQERQQLHQSASAYYEAQGAAPHRAAEHCFYIGDQRRAARLLCARLRDMLHTGQALAADLLLEQLDLSKIEPQQQAEVLLARGEVALQFGTPEQAREHYRRCLEQLAALPASQAFAALAQTAYRGMGQTFEYEAPDEALTWYQRGLDNPAAASGPESGLLELRRGAALLALGDHAGASQALEASLQLLPLAASQQRARAMLTLGVAQALDNVQQARVAFQRALELYQRSDNPWGAAAVWQNLGAALEESGDWNGALTAYAQARTLAERLGSLELWTELELVLGNLALHQGDDEAALRHLQRSLQLAQRHQLVEQELASQLSMAELEMQLGEWPEATSRLDQAQRLAQAEGLSSQLPRLHISLALVALNKQQTRAALKQAQRAVELARQPGLELELGLSLRMLGRVLLIAGKRSQAVEALQQSLALLAGGDAYEEARTRAQLALALRASGAPGAEGLLAEAHATLTRLGARRDLAALQPLLGMQQR